MAPLYKVAAPPEARKICTIFRLTRTEGKAVIV